jgi:hypothetical protein
MYVWVIQRDGRGGCPRLASPPPDARYGRGGGGGGRCTIWERGRGGGGRKSKQRWRTKGREGWREIETERENGDGGE